MKCQVCKVEINDITPLQQLSTIILCSLYCVIKLKEIDEKKKEAENN